MDGKNKTDMASYKFWQTQPVTSFGKNHTATIRIRLTYYTRGSKK
jgi:hypothetical protein